MTDKVKPALTLKNRAKILMEIHNYEECMRSNQKFQDYYLRKLEALQEKLDGGK